MEATTQAAAEVDPFSNTAGFGIRAGARVLDMVFINVFGGIAGLFVGIALAILSNMGAAPADWAQRIDLGFVAYVWGMLASLLYHTASEAIGGASLGKLICGLRVLSKDGTPCSIRGGLIRSLGFFVDGLFFGIVGYGSMKESGLQQRYGDKWGGTIVVRARHVPLVTRRGGGPVVLGVFAGVFAAMACTGLPYFIKVLG